MMLATLRLFVVLLTGSLLAQRLAPDLPVRPSVGCTPTSAGGVARLFAGNRWTNGVVPFAYATNVTPAMQAAMAAAMLELSSRVRVQFVPHGIELDYVVIRDSTINSSPIGRAGGGQFLDIASWNLRFEMVHALMHVLGFWHEHQRPDRDQFVAVQTANVDPALSVLFQLVPVGNTFGLAYDFDSVTHFGATEGGLGGATTLIVLPPNQAQQGAIGQRTHLSVGDIEALRRAYGSLQPPTITQITPGSAPSYTPPQLVINGTALDEVTRIRLDNVAMTFLLQTPTQLRANLPPLATIGQHAITLESGAGASAPYPFTTQGNDPPILFGPSGVSRTLALPFRVFTDATRLNVLLFATDNLPSVAPGIVALGIGSQFATIGEVARGVGPANGDLTFSLRAPASFPAGLRLWMQSVVYDPNNVQLPLSVSNVLPVTVL